MAMGALISTVLSLTLQPTIMAAVVSAVEMKWAALLSIHPTASMLRSLFTTHHCVPLGISLTSAGVKRILLGISFLDEHIDPLQKMPFSCKQIAHVADM